MMQLGYAALLVLLLASGGRLNAQSVSDSPATRVSESAITAHVAFLADDALEGRAPGTRGERLAALYISANFRRLGLLPAGDSGTYLQRFTLLGYEPRTVTPAAPGVLQFGRDFVARPIDGDTAVDISADIVFVGYGVTAPAYGRDDYKGTDVRGRIVVALTGSPLTIDSSRTLGTYYGEDNYKRDEARRRGAAALLLVQHPGRAPVAWEETARRYRNLGWIAPSSASQLRLMGLLNPARASALAERSGTTLAELARAAEEAAFTPRTLGATRLRTRGVVRQRVYALNVTGCLPAADAANGEVVMLGGHYDAYGIGAAVDGDSIYNGALDNASGTATMLAAAEAIATSGVRARRGICFIAFGAEERGLLGSQAFIAGETNPRRIVAMVNIDGANLWGRTRDIAVLGNDQSTLGDTFQRAAEAEGLSVTIHPIEVRQRFYFRSDHLNFARAGIPSLFVRRGKELVEGGSELWQKRFDDYYGTDYHKPADHVRDWFTSSGAAQQARVMVRVLMDAANDPRRPAWVNNSDFAGVVQ